MSQIYRFLFTQKAFFFLACVGWSIHYSKGWSFRERTVIFLKILRSCSKSCIECVEFLKIRIQKGSFFRVKMSANLWLGSIILRFVSKAGKNLLPCSSHFPGNLTETSENRLSSTNVRSPWLAGQRACIGPG